MQANIGRIVPGFGGRNAERLYFVGVIKNFEICNFRKKNMKKTPRGVTFFKILNDSNKVEPLHYVHRILVLSDQYWLGQSNSKFCLIWGFSLNPDVPWMAHDAYVSSFFLGSEN